MYITGLEASGLKGLSFAHELQRCVLFTGPNFVGKSGRLQAIRFGLRGSVPELGKTNQATWLLSGGSAVRVGLTINEGNMMLNRALTKVGESVKEGLDFAPALKELFDVPMPMLDPESYFGLTDSERIQYVFGMMKMPETFTANGIIADLRNLSFVENTEQTEKAKHEVIDMVQAGLRTNGISAALTELTRDKGILKNEFTHWNRRAKDTVGTIRVLSELKTREGEASADNIASVSADLARVAGQLDAANHAAGQLSQRQMEANRVAMRRKQIETGLAQPIAEGDTKTLVTAIAETEAKLKSAKAVSTEELHRLEEAADDASQAVETAEADRTNIQGAIDTAAESLTKLEKQTVCPHCKSKGKDWKKNLRDEYTNVLAEHQTHMATIEKQIKVLTGKHKTAATAYVKAKRAYDARQTLLNERDGSQHRLDSIKASAAGAMARRQALQEELESLGDVSAPTDGELSAAASKVSGLKAEHALLSARHSALVKLQQDLIRAGEAAEEHRVAAAKVAVIKAVGTVLKEKQAAMIETLFGDLMKVANYFTRDIMEHELVFRDGEIGYVKNGRFVSHKTFSGTEKALTYIAITAALMRDAPLRLVLLDEFDIDANVFPRVLDRLAGAVHDGLIDQVVVAHTVAPPTTDAAWQHIPLTKAA